METQLSSSQRKKGTYMSTAPLSSMIVLVTGGAGFIGTNLCWRILSDSKITKLVCLDSLLSGSVDNVRRLERDPRFEFVQGDVCDVALLKRHFMPTEKDPTPRLHSIFHLACPASPKVYQTDPIHTMTTCFEGTRNILDLATANNARMVFTSTSEVYGNPLVPVQAESYFGNVNPVGPRSCYDVGKRVAETLCTEYRNTKATDVCIARLFNTYGPFMGGEDGRVVSTFIAQCLYKQKMTVFGDGSQTRTLCYVDDMVDGLMKLMLTSRNVQGPVNLGGSEGPVTVLEIASRVGAAVRRAQEEEKKESDEKDASPDIVFSTLPVDDPMVRSPDLTLAKTEIGWDPQTTLDRGLHQTVSWFLKTHNSLPHRIAPARRTQSLSVETATSKTTTQRLQVYFLDCEDLWERDFVLELLEAAAAASASPPTVDFEFLTSEQLLARDHNAKKKQPPHKTAIVYSAFRFTGTTFAAIKRVRPTLIFNLSDEHGNKKTEMDLLSEHCDLLIREYYHDGYYQPGKFYPEGPPRNTCFMPLGYMFGFLRGTLSIRGGAPWSADRRTNNWAFVGDLKKQDRPEMSRVFSAWTPNFQGTGKSPAQMAAIYRDSVFVPSAHGNYTQDCLRLYEASACGAIPVVAWFEGKELETFKREENPPWIFAESWEAALVKAQALFADKDKLKTRQRQVHEWWNKRVEGVIKRIANVL